MAAILEKHQVEKLYGKLLEAPSFINALSPYEKDEIQIHAKNIMDFHSQHVFDQFNTMPDLIEQKKTEALSNGFQEEDLFQYLLNEDFRYRNAETIFNLLLDDRVKTERKESYKGLDLTTKQINESALKRTFAFCVCLHFKSHRFKMPVVNQNFLEVYIENEFTGPYKEKNPGRYRPSAHNTRKLLTGAMDWGLSPELRFEEKKPIFQYDKESKNWSFHDVNYEYLISKFEPDWNKASIMVDDLGKIKKF